MATRTNVSLHHDVINKALACKPNRKSLTQFIEDVLDDALDSANTLGKTQLASSLAEQVFTSINKEEKEERVRVREDAAPKPAWEKEIPAHLFEHTDLIRDFWRGKKGSKAERAWKLLMSELTKIQEAHGHQVVGEQLELAINGRWTSVTLANYERFKPKASKDPKDFDWSQLDGVSIDTILRDAGYMNGGAS